jgi:ribosome maturation factor RimP
MVALWYQRHDYDFLTLSDHNKLMEGEYWRSLAGKRAVTPEVIADCRKRFGADWVVLRGEGKKAEVRLKTLAEVRARVEQPGKFLMIQGEEITGKFSGKERDTQIHVTAINLVEPIKPQKGHSAVETLRLDLQAVAEQAKRLQRPILAQVNHPTWKYFDLWPEMLAEVREARLFEVCNFATSEYIMGENGYPGTERMWDIANTLRLARMKLPPLFGVASDDTHAYHTPNPIKFIPGRGWIMVRAAKLAPDALVQAIARGDFYATTGVILKDVTYDRAAKTFTVEVKPDPEGRYTIEFIGTLANYDPAVREVQGFDKQGKPFRMIKQYSADVGKVLARVRGTKATYRLTGKELYVRATVRSDRPLISVKAPTVSTEQAWCQPVGWEQRVK